MLGQLLRFTVVGVSNALVSYSGYALMIALSGTSARSAFLAQAVGYASGVIWSFYWNGRWTFRRMNYPARRFARFGVLQAALGVASSIGVAVSVGVIGLEPLAGWLVVMIPVTLVNFHVSRVWVFKKVSGLQGE